jgi:hypothetical protein
MLNDGEKKRKRRGEEEKGETKREFRVCSIRSKKSKAQKKEGEKKKGRRKRREEKSVRVLPFLPFSSS